MKQLDPKAVWLFFLGSIVQWLVSWIFLFFWLGFFLSSLELEEGFSFSFLNWLWLVIPAILIIAFLWSQLTYRFYRYELTDAGFRKESGVIWKKYVTIPYARIQNVDIYRGVLARILGLSDLQIQTAGASASVSRYGAMGVGSEGRLPALSKAVAEQLRDELIERARKNGGQGV